MHVDSAPFKGDGVTCVILLVVQTDERVFFFNQQAREIIRNDEFGRDQIHIAASVVLSTNRNVSRLGLMG